MASDSPYRATELILRKAQAARTLQLLREAIAEKSFQYSHVIRIADRQAARTRARTTIIKLNNSISFHSRSYARCRASMVKLGADDSTLAMFKVLDRGDVMSSTAILDPNKLGSSRLRLSWIWQTGEVEPTASPDALREFRRVHWLRARSQKQRWEEELRLVHYEMEWTTRYFLHQAEEWKKFEDQADNHQDTGAMAYARRKRAMWLGLAHHAEEHQSMEALPIQPFDPYNLRFGHRERDVLHIQEVINYCESRFRAALNVMQGAEKEIQMQMTSHMSVELEFVMSYIGTAAAMGQVVDIPILIRSLAPCLYRRAAGEPNVTFDPDFLLSLNGGADPDGPHALAESYLLAWWSEGQNIVDVPRLGRATIDACLEHHRALGYNFVQPAPPFQKQHYTWNREVHHAATDEEAAQHCDCCLLHRGVIISIAEEVRMIRNWAQGLHTAYEGRKSSVMRRAAGAYLLMEAALMKETEGTEAGPSAPSDEEARRSRAQAEVARLVSKQNVKWTEGVDLSTGDVKALAQGDAQPGEGSGYVASLPVGHEGEDSIGEDLSGTRYSSLASSVGQDVVEPPAPVDGNTATCRNVGRPRG
ncbi:hypothetical protein NLJ89_g11346 [Agrocybe chaxingu]|uniref:Uncharacterized protein n=1 Tax=Agrocybe chaxingu TaxID=84603 RepID=A0A9W8JPJ3_9AGAR|nr:hypothetical protein NLJ89_g11346 [Agrocybe chaxingu]